MSAAVATPVKAVKAKKVPAKAKPVEHPKYVVMVAAAITALKEKKGSSRAAILKYVIANYKVGDNPTAINARVKTALKVHMPDHFLPTPPLKNTPLADPSVSQGRIFQRGGWQKMCLGLLYILVFSS